MMPKKGSPKGQQTPLREVLESLAMNQKITYETYETLSKQLDALTGGLQRLAYTLDDTVANVVGERRAYLMCFAYGRHNFTLPRHTDGGVEYRNVVTTESHFVVRDHCTKCMTVRISHRSLKLFALIGRPMYEHPEGHSMKGISITRREAYVVIDYNDLETTIFGLRRSRRKNQTLK